MLASLEPLHASRIADDLRESWQCRALVHTQRSHIGVVLLSVLAHNFDDAMSVLMRVAFPGFESISPPFLCTAGKVGKSGQIVADVVQRDGTISKDVAVYGSETELRDDFRRLADDLKLSDSDRLVMFAAVKKWIVADRRLDPTFDPQDPDAKRMVH